MMKDQPMERHGADRHRDPEGDVPAQQADHGCVGADTDILRFSQIHLAAVAADGVPAHAVEGEDEELDHGGHGEGGVREERKAEQKDQHRQSDPEVDLREIGEIEGVSYCFHPNKPLGLISMITK